MKVSSFDFSDKYSPEVSIKHTGKKEKKSRILKLPMEISPVFYDYVERYKIDDALFPVTERFIRYLISDTADKAGVKKKVSASICGIPAQFGSRKGERGLRTSCNAWDSVKRRGRMRK